MRSTSTSTTKPAGLPDADEVSDQTKEELEQERQERLDPDQRPEGAEVDNAVRTFDPEARPVHRRPERSSPTALLGRRRG